MIIAEMLGYPFLSRALAVGLLVSVSASLLGVSLVLRRFSMIGDGLSHVGFGALGAAAFLSLPPLAVTIPVVVISAAVLLHVSSRKKSGGDINAFLFGSILSVTRTDAVISSVLSAITLISYLVFYHQIYATTFDPAFATATGIRTERYTALLSLLTALVIVVGMRILGSLLISSLIIFPASVAMKLCRTYLSVSIAAAVESLLAFVIGFIASYAFSLPTGASIVMVHVIFFALAAAFRCSMVFIRARRIG